MKGERAIPGGYQSPGDLPQVIPVFPLDGALLLPGGELPLRIFEPRYLNLVDDVMAGDRMIGMVQTRAGGERTRPNLAHVGCAGRITSFNETSDGTYLITLTGVCRFEAGEELAVKTPYRQVRTGFAPFFGDLADEEVDPDEFDRKRFAVALKKYLNRRDLDIDWDTAETAPLETLVTSLAMGLPFEPLEKQALLEAPTLVERVDALTTLMEIDALEDGDDAGHSMQ
ncbi:MAG: LON peptidase substrate-binding domain-containing protein [Phenylobacterium sp.]|jgi:Lon protease-like protein|uniref:LON peptidase substrate-binding domain-containing protein n=1 Tax=Phenylobacterium sp. TaxID=1871053 RepID=UPI001B5A5947|nr:LON peptidase substrate-binding domain-containing protein [Phenylobacterium sp.]MBP7817340.1 LON peptidase substrate-binding domain-containing protein [Phenylobacterium sp.]MBP9231748.1 LON peptidase substrate-binding domain-containing protein [Phenylobacterium sp.]MBP9754933.1 LON peptidase substrate-binding domain-containing protein [Phenylobacterium sp.]